MKSSLLKRGARVGVAIGLASGFAATQATPAQAVLPPGQVALAAAGSDTTDQVMKAILNGTNQFNIPSLPGVTGPQNFVVPGDDNCVQDITWTSATSNPPGTQIAPFGSSNGRNKLKSMQTAAAGQNGCVDFARSSGPPRTSAGGDALTFEYYAFAMDAMAWASTSLSAPASMTKAQFKDIYACNITDWSQLPGGGSGPIQRYMPQTGSGTYQFSLSDLLDGVVPNTSSASCPATIYIEENQMETVASADYNKAVVPYAAGNWSYHANNRINPTIDRRNGSRVGGFITGAANANTVTWNNLDGAYQLNTGSTPDKPVNESNVKINNPTPDFPGIRYVYNVTDTVHVNYTQANAVVGFNNIPGGTKSPLCSGGKVSPILSFGYGPLSSAGNPGGATNLAGSTCRKYVPLS